MSLLTFCFLVLPWIAIAFAILALIKFKYSAYASIDTEPADKWVLITGAASGIGLATAKAVLAAGGNVYAVDINEAALQEQFGGNERVRPIRVDVTQQADVDKMALIVANHGDGLYAVVGSAGVALPPGRKRMALLGAAEVDVDSDVLPVFAINLFGMMRVNAALFDLILQSKGVYCNLSSCAGRVAAPGMAVYAATKHAVTGYSAAMRRELKLYDVRVVSVEPGFTETPLLDTSTQAAGPDMSRTKLTLTFQGTGSRESLNDTFGDMQTADDVAAQILSCLFARSANIPPHLLVDEKKWLQYQIISCLPHATVDWIFGKIREQKIRKFEKKKSE